VGVKKNINSFSNPLAIALGHQPPGEARRARQKGQISKLLLIGGAIVFVIILIIFIIFIARANTTKKSPQNVELVVQEPTQPVYEKQIGDINFTLESSEDLGNVLKAKNQYQKDLTTTEKFIQVVVGAQNKGKTATGSYGWDLGNIVDSGGRVFANIDNQASPFLPNPNPCGLSLKPEFYPVTCAKIYEVSKVSKGLKVEITVKDKPIELLDLNLGQ